MRWEGLLLVTVGLAPALPLPSYCGPGPCPAPAQPIEIWAVWMRGVDKTRRLIKTAGKAVNLGVSAWVQGLQCLGALRALSKILAEF